MANIAHSKPSLSCSLCRVPHSSITGRQDPARPCEEGKEPGSHRLAGGTSVCLTVRPPTPPFDPAGPIRSARMHD